jgi:superfamily II DNA or RNA helicase
MNQKSIIQQECLEAIGNRRLAGAVLGTGAGKTLLGLKHMASKYHDVAMFLVVAPKVSIHAEWLAQARDHGLEYLIPHIKFTTYLSLHKQPFDYDVVYFDECHNSKLKHARWMELYPGTIIGLTGTYPKYVHSESYIICNQYFPVVYKYTIADGIAANMLNDYKIYIHLLSLDKAKTYRAPRGGLMSEETNYQMWCKIISTAKPKDVMLKRIMRMKAIQSYRTKVMYAKKLMEQQTEKTLVFTDYTNQADMICQHVYHSKEKMSKENLELFRSGKISRLASVLQIAEGANIPNLKVGIIMHAYANEKKLSQKIGRFLRLNPNEQSIVHVLCYKDTVDLDWCKKALKDFDKTKIFKYNGPVSTV